MARWTVPGLFAVLALLAGVRALHSLGEAVANPTVRAGLVAVYFLLRTAVTVAFAALTLHRPAPLRPSREPAAFAACAVAMLLVIPIGGPGGGTSTGLVLTGDVIALLAGTWLLVSVLALGHCFGILPEARGLVIRGPYRFLRHPVYLGEIGALAGLTLAELTLSMSAAWSVAILGAFLVAQSIRMRMEEDALTAAFPEYRLYAAQTGRLLPRLRAYRQLPRRLDLSLVPPSASSVVTGDPGR
jgi:protein-S-isoprenylcysteine O-methyltransferase Ste14